MKTIDRNATINVHHFRFGTNHPERMKFYDCLNDKADSILNRNPIEVDYSSIGSNINAEIMLSANKLRTLLPIMASSFVAFFILF